MQEISSCNIDRSCSVSTATKRLTFLDEPGEIAPATRLLSGWGLKFFDYDNDGDPDLFLANGHPDDMVDMRAVGVKYKEPLLMFENTGRSFRNVSAQSGAVFNKELAARGMTVGDYDKRGDLERVYWHQWGSPAPLAQSGR